MKRHIAALSLAALTGLGCAGTAFAEASAMSVNGGSVHFIGSLTDGPCALKANAPGARLVTLDQVEVSQLANPGEAAGQVRLFHVVLEDCNISVYTNASISFSGQTDPRFTSVLVNQATDDAAEHVGLQLYDSKGQAIIPNDSSAVPLTAGMNVIPLTVDYVPTGLNAKPGAVTSTVTFNIVYS